MHAQIVSGQRPFPEARNDMQVIAKVVAGRRPRWAPASTTDDADLEDFKWLAELCWNRRAAERPPIRHVVRLFRLPAETVRAVRHAVT